MSGEPTDRWICDGCSAVVADNALLREKSPFNANDIITGCPECGAVESFQGCCDEPGCTKLSTCGWNHPTGYRRTCYKHSFWIDKSEQLQNNNSDVK